MLPMFSFVVLVDRAVRPLVYSMPATLERKAYKAGGCAMASSIEWTDETWNPVTGCTRVSPGCDHCYMYALYPRLRGMGGRGYDAAPEIVQVFPERLELPLTWKKPRRVFVNSMSDLFHPAVEYGFISEVFLVMSQAAEQRGHIFQVLTRACSH